MGPDAGHGFVGRRRELGRIDRVTRAALAGDGGVLLVTGEPGIGKSRVAEEAGARAEALGAAVLRGRCWDAGGAPAYWPWTQVARALGRMPGGLVSPELERLSGMAFPAAEPRDEARVAFFEGIRDALRAASVMTPLVLVLEDLHAADLPSLELMRTVAADLSGARLLLIGTYREAESLEPALSRLLGQIASEEQILRLSGFSKREVATLVRSRFRDVSGESVASSLHRMTGGNPLFLEEILSLVNEGETLDESRLRNLTVPDHVRDVIARRLAHLPKPSQDLLATASVVGPEFDLGLLTAAAGTVQDVAEALAPPEEAGIVRAQSASPRRYAFTHDLFREVVYGHLPATERLELHAVIGETLEEEAAHRVSHADLAYHFLRAAPRRGRERALRYSELAGHEAMEQLAWESAARHFGQALAMAELPPMEPASRRCELLLQLGEATWALGAFERSKDAFRKAARLAEEASQREMLARAALGASGHAVFLDMGAGGVDEPRTGLLAKTLAALATEDSPLRARVLARLCAALSLTPTVEQRAALAVEAVEMARGVRDDETLADVLHATSWGTWGPDGLEERLRVSEEVIRLAGKTGRSGVAVLSRFRRLHHFLEAADLEGARFELEETRLLVERLPQMFYQWVAALQEAVWATVVGDFGAAERHSLAALRIGQESENPNAHRLFGIQNVFVLRELGRLGEIVGAVESAVAALPDFAAWRSALAWTYAEIGRNDDARRELEVLARNDFAGVPRDLYWLSCLWGASEACFAVEDRDIAESLYRRLAPYAGRCMVVYSGAFGGSIARTLGALAALLGRFDAAAEHFAEAQSAHERMGARSWAAHTRFDEARALLRRGRSSDRRRAEDLLAKAREEARELGMAALEQRVEALGKAAKAEPTRRSANVFRLDGEYWTIRWQGKRIPEPDSKGLRYLARLLSNPGRELHVMELAEAGTRAVPGSGQTGEAAREMTASSGLGDAGEVLDSRAEASYRAHLRQLEDELEGATGARAKQIRKEMAFLSRELRAARGLGGRRRKAADTADRARKAVTGRLRYTLARIEKAHPGLGRHLAASVHLGTFCSYTPRRATLWEL